MLEIKLQNFLLGLSRKALELKLTENKEFSPDVNLIPEELKKVSATFVTLTKNEELRGCIGKLVAVNPIYKDVIENTYLAAFQDFRFPPVALEELDQIKIEISILSQPAELKYQSPDELIKVLNKQKCGVVLSNGFQSATFLPQVWEELIDASDFLSHLCQKAGLDKDYWKLHRVKIETYTVDKFEEELN